MCPADGHGATIVAVRPATTIALALLLLAIFIASLVQFLSLAR